jgi:pimeloyl-ACP methyl ester carboxylesterase
VASASALDRVRAGRDLRVTVWEPGAAAGSAVFLVHGAGGRADQWRHVVPALQAAGHRVVAFDALGHGESPRPRRWRAYDGREWVADLQALVARHGAARNVLVGHSYGTRIVLGALQGGVPNVVGVLLLAPPAPETTRRLPWFTYLPVPLLERLRPKLSAGFRAAAWGPDTPVALVDEETAISDRNSLYVFKATWRQRLVPDAGALAMLRLPVTVIAGELDRLTPPDGARALVATLPGSTLEILPRCGHQIPLERADAVVRALAAGAASASASSAA